MYLESNNGKFRLVNSPWSAEVFSVDQSGNVVANGRLTTNEYVQINGTATEGAACSPNGLVGRDGTGLLLSCQSGIWKKASMGAFKITDGEPCWFSGVNLLGIYVIPAQWVASGSTLNAYGNIRINPGFYCVAGTFKPEAGQGYCMVGSC